MCPQLGFIRFADPLGTAGKGTETNFFGIDRDGMHFDGNLQQNVSAKSDLK